MVGHVAMTLQLLFYLGTSSVERMSDQHCLVFDLWNEWKNLLPINKKVKIKNQIPKYYTSSLIEMMRKIRKQLINEKPPNLVWYYGGKLKNLWNVIDEKTS